MSNYVEQNLKKDEKIIATVKRSALSLVGTALKTVIAIIISIAGTIILEQPLLIAIAPLAVIICVGKIISYYRTTLTLTDQRLIFRRGVFSTHSSDIPYEQVEKVEVDQSLFGKIFHYASLEVMTGDIEGEGISAVVDCDKIKNLIVTQSDEKKRKAAEEQAAATAKAMREAFAAAQNIPNNNAN